MTPLRVLVADDDPETLLLVSDAIVQLGAVATPAATGAELIERLAEGSFDLVVTDVSMPWMSGLQAVHSARTAGWSTPIVIITGLRDAKTASQVRSLGDDATLLYKPFGIDQLHAAIHRVLSRHAPNPISIGA